MKRLLFVGLIAVLIGVWCLTATAYTVEKWTYKYEVQRILPPPPPHPVPYWRSYPAYPMPYGYWHSWRWYVPWAFPGWLW